MPDSKELPPVQLDGFRAMGCLCHDPRRSDNRGRQFPKGKSCYICQVWQVYWQVYIERADLRKKLKTARRLLRKKTATIRGLLDA